MSKDVSKAIFDARMRGTPIEFVMASGRRRRTEQIIKLWEAGVLTWASKTEGFGKAFSFYANEAVTFKTNWLQRIITTQKTLRVEEGQEVMIYKLRASMLLEHLKKHNAELLKQRARKKELSRGPRWTTNDVTALKEKMS